jgi:Fic family protein
MDILKIKPNVQKAVFLAKRAISELVYDAINLEGICFTLPEVQTLLEGITIGGHRLSDQNIALNQARAWKLIFDLVIEGKFALSQETACLIHAQAAKEDALEWGRFRSGSVTIAGTSYVPPKAQLLNQVWNEMVERSHEISQIYERAIFIFLEMSRNQFFYDVNKRMGRFMMNGILLAHGYPVINVPASKKVEFNTLMLNFYESHQHQKMHTFMINCLDPRTMAIMAE